MFPNYFFSIFYIYISCWEQHGWGQMSDVISGKEISAWNLHLATLEWELGEGPKADIFKRKYLFWCAVSIAYVWLDLIAEITLDLMLFFIQWENSIKLQISLNNKGKSLYYSSPKVSVFSEVQTHVQNMKIFYSLSCVNVCCCSVAKSCLILWDSGDCSTPGSSVLHYLSKFAQIYVHWVDRAM